ncbi:MAG TPA: hypothetical protein VGF92_03530 [Stellaceae bacterium]|jgi:hypothetical protein
MDMLDKWHDFFLILGAAAGTLIGSMFVVVSIASGMIRGGELTSRIFVTPTIVHLAVVLLGCALVVVPTLTPLRLGFLALAGGIAFLAYAGRNAFHIEQRRAVDWSDHLWYAVLPLLAYLVLIAGAVMLITGREGAIEILGLALALLIMAGIRNAWDLILFFLERQATAREAQNEPGNGPVA